jgi:hypothetical protein
VTGYILGQSDFWEFWFERAPSQQACIITQCFWGKAEASQPPSQDASTRYLTVAVHVVSSLGRCRWSQPYALEVSTLRWSARLHCVYWFSLYKQMRIQAQRCNVTTCSIIILAFKLSDTGFAGYDVRYVHKLRINEGNKWK